MSKKNNESDRMQWWTEARFGMFIHWGLYSMAARHEWVKKIEEINDSVDLVQFTLAKVLLCTIYCGLFSIFINIQIL